MRKTTVYLSEEQKQRIRRIARTSGMTDAEVIRAAVDRYTEESAPKPIWPRSAGFGRSGRIGSAHIDTWLDEEWQRDR